MSYIDEGIYNSQSTYSSLSELEKLNYGLKIALSRL